MHEWPGRVENDKPEHDPKASMGPLPARRTNSCRGGHTQQREPHTPPQQLAYTSQDSDKNLPDPVII
ncbi:Uncharacterised protein [Mycobacteroides abscessus subsp. bolletii]|nr:Uncharacterised protein [Mycobacteroides abscessus subsp. bolletii]SKQ45402.1 Uncharacterised protein [Mycobacteroides abscessus subsp. bolletii]SKQ47714.1 Uncharacterised protein [Mycobacteroides abscessus subsp. bolletii]SKQ50121.1 Uncharacterised protein [Mycobacteroides abscessus subsp. bolletii]